MKKHVGAEHPAVVASLNNLAGLYDIQGRYEEAELFYQQALEIMQQHIGTEHPDVATCLNNLAILYDNQGRYEEAEPLFRQALEILFQKFGENHPSTHLGLGNFFQCASLAFQAGKGDRLSNHPLTQAILKDLREQG